MPNATVYTIFNIVTKRRYFGSTKAWRARWAAHRRDLERGVHHTWLLQRDYDAHGLDSLRFRVLREFDSIDVARDFEQSLISQFYGRAHLYNTELFVDNKFSRMGRGIRVTHLSDYGYVFVLFGSLHAAIRHFGFQKTAVKKSIASGDGRIGKVQFPINVGMRMEHPGRWLAQELPRPKRAPYCVEFSQVMADGANIKWLARILGTNTKKLMSIAHLKRCHFGSFERDVLFYFCLKFGWRWVDHLISGELLDHREIPRVMAKFDMQHESEINGILLGDVYSWVTERTVMPTIARRLLTILDKAGLQPFAEFFGLTKTVRRYRPSGAVDILEYPFTDPPKVLRREAAPRAPTPECFLPMNGGMP